MKVDNQGRPLTTQPTTAAPARARVDNQGSAPRAAQQDTVSLSASSQLQAAEKALGNVPVANADKVREIKEAIAQGKFSINAEAIADGLIDSVKDLLADRKAR
ncbi:flagellar biosynthesis anti-sigma factor FlgM [Leeia sp.]|uniref:flagellar biosynthesis anti-sigma factor FlgM n=1 Tax=Leeia sp. TaxID=2884678 RepID=UPI0035B38487